MKKGSATSLLPIGVFLALYLGLGIAFEYVLKIEMGFYKVPIVVAFLCALLVACLQDKDMSFDKKLEIMGRGIGDKNIVTMILIFLTAGIFVGVVGRTSAESVAYFMLSILPARFAVVMLFTVSCLVSVAMGTSVGTITLIVPVAIAIANAADFSMPLCIASVIGGSMFGDNLSFISDTTIAACNGQGCAMKDKFKANFFIALPAAIATLIIIFFLSAGTDISEIPIEKYDLVKAIPYLLVLVGGIAGINVFIILIVGILSGSVITLLTGGTFPELTGSMGNGAADMFETILVTVLVSAICALIRERGGFDFILNVVKKVFKGKRGGTLGIGLLVGIMDVATANNTVAIVMANPIAKEMSVKYGISPKKTASILDTFSCIFQGVIPYGAQMLVAISAANGLGTNIGAFDIMPYLFYPAMLLLSSLVFVFIIPSKKN